jgi:hypothetical protein
MLTSAIAVGVKLTHNEGTKEGRVEKWGIQKTTYDAKENERRK